MLFKEIPVHENTRQRLLSLADNDRIPHALLIEGPSGTGKFALARAFAQYIHCTGRKPGDKPRLIFAWFNKGNIYYSAGDFTSALQCFSEAIKTDPNFGEAYFNRGLTYLQSGNKKQAFADLSKAGELGVLPSYNILKRMQ